MITEFLLQVPYYFLNLLIGLFPASSGFPAEVVDSASYIGGFVTMFSPILPLATLLICLTIIVQIELAIFGFRSIKWIISHIPAFGGRG